MVVAAVVILIVLAGRPGAGDDSTTGSTAGSGVVVTSPYDFSELPTDEGPAAAAKADYVSILLVEGQDQLTSYGLKNTIPAAQALIQAVVKANEVDDPATTVTTEGSVSGQSEILNSSLTFRFEDMSTLTFDLYPNDGLIARDGRAWKVQGDLDALIEDAIAAVQG